MLDKIGINVDLDLSRALSLIAEQISVHNPQAAHEARVMAGALRGIVMHCTLNGSEIVCRACDALRKNHQPELVEKMEALIQLIKAGQNRQIIGSFLAGATAQDLLQAAGAAGATMVGIEDPRNGNVVPIAKIRP